MDTCLRRYDVEIIASFVVVPAKAGTHFATKLGLPATAKLIPRNAFCGRLRWIPAYAGMTKRGRYDVNLVRRLIAPVQP